MEVLGALRKKARKIKDLEILLEQSKLWKQSIKFKLLELQTPLKEATNKEIVKEKQNEI